jgi:hypothetical protein
MKKKILLSIGVPVLTLIVMAGCGQNSSNNTTTDMTNNPPLMSSNLPPITNTDLINTNLSTNATGVATNNP